MSFSSLPPELVDQICSSLTKHAQYVGQITDVKSLLTFCLVSKQTLPSARRALYRQPLETLDSTVRRIVWQQAEGLLSTLKVNDYSLGRLVRQTAGFGHWLVSSRWLDRKNKEDARKRLLDWYLRFLVVCPNIEQVDLIFSTKEELTDLLQVLALPSACPTSHSAKLRSSLRTLTFDFDLNDNFDANNVLTILECYSINAPVNVVHNVSCLVPPGTAFSAPSLSLPRFPWPVKGFDIRNATDSLTAWIPFFPRDNSTLQHSQLFNSHEVRGPELKTLPKLLGSNLRSLALDFQPSEYHAIGGIIPSLARYSNPIDAPSLPLETFLSFPHLTKLELLYTHGPSLLLVESLAFSSPLLVHLSFHFSCWISDSGPRSTTPEDVFPNSQILSTLLKFKDLKFLDLGILPTTDYTKYKGLKNTLESLGIRVVYECCC